MLTAITHHQVWVFDQDEALDFYVGKLGLEITHDVDLEVLRWLTVSVPGRPERQIVLMLPQPPAVEAGKVEQVRELVASGNGGMFILATDDCRAEHARLAALGVEFTDEPTERFYGIDCGMRDPFGNHIRMTQPAPQPVVPPAPQSAATGA
ncbi:MAG TPA: VOC family protein [Baekduia sp.]|nr:VOC family protein [Baekduia sp.]